MIKIDKAKKVGLALSGGVVLGAAHIGVIKALEESGIKIDYISGTSAGALVSSLYAFNKNSEILKEIALAISWSNLTELSFSRLGLLSNNKMKELIHKYIGEATFDQMKIQLAIIATNITTGKKVIIENGDVATAVMASTSIPGIFKPVALNDQLLVDGGLVEHVPISPLKKMGADFIIAVDLNSKYIINRKPKNVVEVLLNSFHFSLSNTSKIQTADADILIEPSLSAFNIIDMKQASDLINKGYEETINELEKAGLG